MLKVAIAASVRWIVASVALVVTVTVAIVTRVVRIIVTAVNSTAAMWFVVAAGIREARARPLAVPVA